MILGPVRFDRMRWERILDMIRPLKNSGAGHTEIKGLAYDSRHVRPGYLFVAVHGHRLDGSDFIQDAIERGAAAVVGEAPALSYRHIHYAQVRDARLALAQIACAFYDHPAKKLDVIGVTGTNGKTTTTYMIQAILRRAGRRPGLIGTVRYEIGERSIPAARTTPEAPDLQAMLDQMDKAGCRSVVMEVSSHALDQKRTHGIDFDVAVFTNLTRDHIDYHGSMDNYFEAKLNLFRGLGAGGKDAHAVVNLDDPRGVILSRHADIAVPMVTYGTGPDARVRAEDIVLDARGSRFTADTPWGRREIRLKTLGRFNVSNALAAMAACGVRGVDLDTMAEALGDLPSIPGRMEPVPNRRGLHVYVDYAHTDDALQNVLEILREIMPGRLIAVFGCGGNRDTEKRPLMGAAAERWADFTVVTSDNPRQEKPGDIIAGIVQGMRRPDRYTVIPDREEAIRHALDMAAPGDAVLIAGKGHENYQEFANTVIPFDDADVARRLLSDEISR